MKIKETLSSIRELENQFRKINKQDKGSSSVQEFSSQSPDAVSISVQQSESDSARTKRVADLKNLISSGSYQPDSRKIAESVIRDLF